MTVTDIRAHLQQHLHGMAAPFLFVGAGLSRRYAATEGWEDLLRRFAEETNRPYDYYRTSVEGDLPAVASAIAEQFHHIWWKEERFASSRQQWAGTNRSPESALKVEVAHHLRGAADSLPVSGVLAEEIALLKDAIVDGVITTNYDPVLEAIFPDYRVFVGQDEMLFSNPQGVGELYKIHGCCSQPDSLVLTAADYQRFEDRDAYLAAKLLTIFVEHPVIFLGYSLTDNNVTSILRSIAGCLTEDNLSQLQDQLLFVQWQDGAEATVTSHTMMVDGFIIPVQRLIVSDFRDVFAALGGLSRAFPAKLLRRLKEQVYELVLTNDPHNQLMVADIDDSTEDESIDVVFGVGMQERLSHLGYAGLNRLDLINDVVDDTSQYDPRAIVNVAVPSLPRGNANFPIFKYLRQADLLDGQGHIKPSSEVDQRIIDLISWNRDGIPVDAEHTRKAPNLLRTIDTITELEETHGAKGVLGYATYLPPEKVNTGELLQFIKDHRSFTPGSWEGTQWIKLVCFYDWLTYG